jgi:molybdopterin/thiamine biosynthesis adenylyltransferase
MPEKCEVPRGDPVAIFARLGDIFDARVLADRTVTVIGLGTGGSFAAVELARCAVGSFRLVDFDRLELHNVARHACGVSDLGRLKTEAIRDAILNVNPAAKIDCHEIDITAKECDLTTLLLGSDIVLACTDTDRSKYYINRALLGIWFERAESIPAIYAGAYERAFGGDVIRVIPGQTPCYDCVIGSVQRLSIFATKPKGPVPYSSLETSNGFRAEPGLGIDVHFIALIQAKLALMTLLRTAETSIEDIPFHFLFWGNRKEWIFPEPFKCIFATTQFRSDCDSCAGQTKESPAESALSRQRVEAMLQDAGIRAQDSTPDEVADVDIPEDLLRWRSIPDL